MFKRIDHVEIVPSNVEKSLDFYTSILEFKIKGRHKVNVPPLKEVIYLELGDAVVEFLAVENTKGRSLEPWQVGYRMIALEVENMNEAIGYLKGKGINATWGPVNLGRSVRAEIADPDGIPIELRNWK